SVQGQQPPEKEPPVPLGPSGQKITLPLLHCSLVLPDRDWKKEDHKVLSKSHALVMKRFSPTVWFALYAKDYKKFNPDPGQLLDETVRRLGNSFQKLEWEEGGELELSGTRAQRLTWRGLLDNATVTGECYVFAHKGIGYELTAWTSVDLAQRSP